MQETPSNPLLSRLVELGLTNQHSLPRKLESLFEGIKPIEQPKGGAELIESKAIEQLRAQAREFKEYLQRHKKLVVAHHIDADGLMSAVLLLQLLSQEMNVGLRQLLDRVQLFSINNGLRNFDDEQMAKVTELRQEGYTGVVFVDLPARDIEQLTKLRQMGYEVGSVDHHETKASVPFDVQLNPATISGLHKVFLTQFSTTALLYPFLRDGKEHKWMATIGNLGDESYMLSFEDDPEKTLAYYEFARKLNMLGTTEKFNVSPLERDAFIYKLLTAFLFTFDTTLSTGFEAAKKIIDEAPLFKERFDSIGHALWATEVFLLQAANLANDRIASKVEPPNEAAPAELMSITNVDGQMALVLEGNDYRVLVHEIDSEGFVEGNMVIGSIIKSHQNALRRQQLDGRPEAAKPTTVLLAQKRDNKITELGLYTVDDRVITSQDFSCSAIMTKLREIYKIGGGGHADRAGGDIPNESFGAALWYVFMELAEFLNGKDGVQLPWKQEPQAEAGEDFITKLFYDARDSKRADLARAYDGT